MMINDEDDAHADDNYGDDDDESRVTAGCNLSWSSAAQISGWAHFLMQLVSSFNVDWPCSGSQM